MESLLRVSLLGCTALLSSCGIFGSDSYRYERPLVAVVDFENRVDFPLNWRLGEGIAEILENSLYQTDSFRVLDRGDIDHVLKEQTFQASGNTREEQSVVPNRLKNARYLVKGVITEFAPVAMTGIDFGFGSWRLGGGGNYAIVNIALKVTDVESGELAYSEVIDGKVYAGGTRLRSGRVRWPRVLPNAPRPRTPGRIGYGHRRDAKAPRTAPLAAEHRRDRRRANLP